MPRPSGSARNRSLPPQIRGSGRTPAPDSGRDSGREQGPTEIPAGLERLREHIRRLEGFGGTLTDTNRRVLPFGIDEIDSRLPGGGLARGALHEMFAADAGIATAFCALIAGRLLRGNGSGYTGNCNGSGMLLWCERPRTLDAGALYGPALPAFGIDPERMILVRARRDRDVLWAMEEGLRCSRLAVVVGEIESMSLTASRRLQLAAEQSGVTALALRAAPAFPRNGKPAPSAAATRWRLDAAERAEEWDESSANENDNQTDPAFDEIPPGLGAARWRAEMFRCRGGAPALWMMEWNDETCDFSVSSLVRNRPPVPSAARLAG